jgi:cytidylate kinase
MIITIDGPAGTGKSTVAQTVALNLGFDFLDTGAMYRAIGLAAIRRQTNLEDERELAYVARMAKIVFNFEVHPPEVLLNGEPVGHLLRASDATRAASFVALVPAVRELLVKQQQLIGASRPNLVTDGRDQGTVVFPHAELKFYLDATPIERARRRATQLRARGEVVDIGMLQNQIMDRDSRDARRAVGPLAVPPGAEVIDTTSMSMESVVEHIVAKARKLQRRPDVS